MTALHSQWYETPDLPGDHVKLVQLHRHHAAGVLEAADDDEVFQWLRYERPTTLAEARAIVDDYEDDPQRFAWAQIDQKSNELAGLTTYYDVDPEQRTVAIGHTWLGKKYWRTPINSEAKLLLLTRAFEVLDCVRVVWHTDNMNERSQAAIERLGGKREGAMRKHRQRADGSWRDTVMFSMLDDEWPAAKKALEKRLAED